LDVYFSESLYKEIPLFSFILLDKKTFAQYHMNIYNHYEH